MNTERTDNSQNRLLRALDVASRPIKSQHLSAYSQDQLQKMTAGALPGADKLDAHQLADLPFDQLLDEARSLSMDQLKQVVGETDHAGMESMPAVQNQGEAKPQDMIKSLDHLTQYANKTVNELLNEVQQISDLSRRQDAERNKET